jgi:uncharacterized protein (TIGR00290 family)
MKTYFNWSTGKDSALALYHLLKQKDYQVEKLLIAINAYHNRVSMHGLRRELMEQQIDALGIPFTTLELPEQHSMEEYETIMIKTVLGLVKEGFEYSAFGDIFLEDLRAYREKQLAACGIKALFPLWKKNSKKLLNEFIHLGFKAILVCVNGNMLDASFAGRVIDKNFILDLPPGIDPCGENGEFHTFCFDGPIFKKPVEFLIGEKIFREYKSPGNSQENIGFWFCDLLPHAPYL